VKVVPWGAFCRAYAMAHKVSKSGYVILVRAQDKSEGYVAVDDEGKCYGARNTAQPWAEITHLAVVRKYRTKGS
jgi:hypothetical protein